MSYGHFVGIGSNLGARMHFPQALGALLLLSPELTLSRVLETEPEGMASDALFLNAVVYFRADVVGADLKTLLNAIETRLGRDRSEVDRSRKDRCIDLDVLLSVPSGSIELSPDQIACEKYFRPQMLELVHKLEFVCELPQAEVSGAVEVEFEGRRVGNAPVRISRQFGQVEATIS